MILSGASLGSSPAEMALGIAAVLAYALAAFFAWRGPGRAVVGGGLMGAWALHGSMLVLGLTGLGADGQRFGFAPALSVTAWLVLTVYGVESRLLPALRSHGSLAVLGAASVLLALVFPGNALHKSASVWLPLHWALGIASYGMFAVAVVHAWLMSRAERQMRVSLNGADTAGAGQAGVPLLTLERLTFRFVGAGFVLLSATLLAGWFFTEALYGPGKGWKWDHKTVFSLLSWAAFAALLLGRARFGWRGRKAVRVLYVGAAFLLLGYVGSRFVLEVVLGRAL